MLDPTRKFILQACHTDSAIRHAVIAMGAMGQRLRTNHLLTSDNEEANKIHDFAQAQYCKALNHLRAHMSSNPEGSMHLAIISCFLFTIFEFLQGNDEGSLVHLKSGLNILRRELEASAGEQQDALRKEVTRVFSIMDIQATAWLVLPTFRAPAIMPLEALNDANQPIEGPGAIVPPNLYNFLTLEAAAASLNYQITRMYHFRRSVTAYTTTLEDVPPNVYARRQDLLEELDRWPIAVDTLLARIPTLTEEMKHRVTVMRLNYRLTSLLLTSCLHDPTSPSFDHTYQPYFRQMLDLAKSLISSDLPRPQIYRIVALNNRDINPVPLFSFYAGIVQPLFFVAVNSTDLVMAKEAICMLRDDPWREGAWDSVSMARIADRKVKQQRDQGYYDGYSLQAFASVPFETLLEGGEDPTDSMTDFDGIPVMENSCAYGLSSRNQSWPNTSGSSPSTMPNTGTTGSSTEMVPSWDSPSTLSNAAMSATPEVRYSPFSRRGFFHTESLDSADMNAASDEISEERRYST